jgi:hypothetical protein
VYIYLDILRLITTCLVGNSGDCQLSARPGFNNCPLGNSHYMQNHPFERMPEHSLHVLVNLGMGLVLQCLHRANLASAVGLKGCGCVPHTEFPPKKFHCFLDSGNLCLLVRDPS